MTTPRAANTERDGEKAMPERFDIEEEDGPRGGYAPFSMVCRENGEYVLYADYERTARELEQAIRERDEWARAAVAFRFRADHAMKCRSRKTGSSDSCNCPLRVAMQNLEEVMSRLSGDGHDKKGAQGR